MRAGATLGESQNRDDHKTLMLLKAGGRSNPSTICHLAFGFNRYKGPDCSEKTNEPSSTGKVSSAAAIGFAGIFLVGLCYRQFKGEAEDEESERRKKEYAILRRRTDEFEWSTGLDDSTFAKQGADTRKVAGGFGPVGRTSTMLEEMRPKQLLPYPEGF